MTEQLPKTSETILSPEQQERVKLTICRFFEEKLARLMVGAANDTTKQLAYVQRFYELCTNQNRPWTQQKEFSLSIQGMSGPLRIRFDQHSCYSREFQQMDVNIGPLLNARTVTELENAMYLVLEDIYHETEHIFTPGASQDYGIEVENAEEWIKYASHPGEINAFARQFAFRYYQEYTDEPFLLEKMQTLASRLKAENPNHIQFFTYFIAFANPSLQEKYRPIANLADIHTSITKETDLHLKKLKREI